MGFGERLKGPEYRRFVISLLVGKEAGHSIAASVEGEVHSILKAGGVPVHVEVDTKNREIERSFRGFLAR